MLLFFKKNQDITPFWKVSPLPCVAHVRIWGLFLLVCSSPEGRGWLSTVGSTCWYTGGTQQCSLSGWPFCLGLKAVLWLGVCSLTNPPPGPPRPSPKELWLPSRGSGLPSELPHQLLILNLQATVSTLWQSYMSSNSCQGQMRFRYQHPDSMATPTAPGTCPDLQQHRSMQWMFWLLICHLNMYLVRTFWARKVLHWAGACSKSNEHRTKAHSFPQDSNSHPLFKEGLSHVPVNVNFFILGICFPFIRVSFSD